jgi:two-component system, NarL family, sensor histidine kinase UhpB
MQTKICCILFIFLQFQTLLFGQNAKLDSLFNILKTQKDDTNKVKTLGSICGILRNTDLEKSIVYGKKGAELAEKIKFDKGIALCYLNLSTSYMFSYKLDSAIILVNKSLEYALKVGEPKRLGLAHLNRADYYRQQQNISQSLKDCATALKYAELAKDEEVKARINQTFGSVYLHQSNYSQAILYIDLAIKGYQKVGNKRMEAVALNNLGLVYKNQKNYPKSIIATKKAIQITDSLKDINNLSIYYANLSDLFFSLNNLPDAEKAASKAMEYGQIQKNEKLIAEANLVIGNTYNAQKRYADAAEYTEKALLYFTREDYTDKINTSADLLAEVYAHLGNYKKSYENMVIAKASDDSLDKWRYDDDISAMQTKFKVDEKDKEIKLLATEKELQSQKLTRQRLIMYGSLGIILLASLGIWQLFNRRKLKEKLHELEIRNQIATDLHDEVGSSLSSIQMLSQMVNNQPHTDEKERAILQKMSNNAKETMEKMSDIVWMIKPGENDATGLADRIQRFLYEIGESKNIECNFSSKNIESVELSMADRKNIYLIFKEAVNNAAKYSGTNIIEVSLEHLEKLLILTIKDFGKGFDIEHIRRGNGLENMQNRAKELSGELSINTSINSGTKIDLKIKI